MFPSWGVQRNTHQCIALVYFDDRESFLAHQASLSRGIDSAK